jgi:hypothetical protein
MNDWMEQSPINIKNLVLYLSSVAHDLLCLVCWNFTLIYVNNYDEVQVLRFVILKITIDLYDK